MGIPMVATVAKIAPSEMTVEDMPIICGVVIFDMTIQKIYPKKRLPNVST